MCVLLIHLIYLICDVNRNKFMYVLELKTTLGSQMHAILNNNVLKKAICQDKSLTL